MKTLGVTLGCRGQVSPRAPLQSWRRELLAFGEAVRTGQVRLAPGGDVILTRPCVFTVEND
jgi:hypothetical protein